MGSWAGTPCVRCERGGHVGQEGGVRCVDKNWLGEGVGSFALLQVVTFLPSSYEKLGEWRRKGVYKAPR